MIWLYLLVRGRRPARPRAPLSEENAIDIAFGCWAIGLLVALGMVLSGDWLAAVVAVLGLGGFGLLLVWLAT